MRGVMIREIIIRNNVTYDYDITVNKTHQKNYYLQ